MLGIINLGAFLLAGILLNLTPGADTMYILSRSIANGKKAGILSAVGISVGSLVHTLFAALGLSVLLAESQLAYDVVKYLGAAYLIYLGIRSIFTKDKNGFELNQNMGPTNHKKIFFSGIITNVLNPKVALFYLAFLPQFIDPNYSNAFLSFLMLGILFTITSTIWCLVLALFASKLSDKIRKNYRIKVWLDRITGFVFIGLGVKLALSEK